MKDKHTPLPWVVCPQVIRKSGHSTQIYLGPEDHPLEGDVVIYGCNQEANVRLIAAAPELLEALERLSAWGAGVTVPSTQANLAAIIHDANAVISKVEEG